MSFIQAALWGLAQGLTDLLPVSGSAHRAIFERLFGLQSTDNSLFYAMLELGLLLVIVIAFRRDAAVLLRTVRRMLAPDSGPRRRRQNRTQQRMVFLLLIGLIPLLTDIFLSTLVGQYRTRPLFYALILVLNGLILFACDFIPKGEKTQRQMKIMDALLIGLGQAVSVVPGFSRTGLTLAAGYVGGLKASFAVTYSFLLSIPFLFGSAVIHTVQAVGAGIDAGMLPRYFVGVAVCVAAGFFALQGFLHLMEKRQLRVFSYYCWGAAAFSFFLFLIT